MLHLQRASAGSGKTFMLAKTFIRNFLAKKDENGKYVLREHIGDSHSEILAITFTNKATNEMKQRIVDKLADLAGITNKPAEKTDYLYDFMKEFEVDEQCIRNQAMKGMKKLLHSYSFFQISTIDSFFQTVLRTFANDIDLNDNYQIELNDTYVAQMGVDATLTTVNDEKSINNKKIIHWINKIVAEKLQKGQSWNPFNKNIDAKGGVYKELISFTKIIYKETFKVIQDELLQYFEENVDIFDVINSLNAQGNALVVTCRDRCKDDAKEIENILASHGENSDCCYRGFSTLLKHIIVGEDLSAISKSLSGGNTRKFLNNEISLFAKSHDKNNRLTNLMPKLPKLAFEMIEKAEEWVKVAKLNSINISKLHYLGILKEILGNIKEFREENNLILLSDTNQFLQKIIGEEDAPFIYERIGTFINHYLIDEFQDTSQLQWNNLRPLLLESISKDYDSLIIGDVKQSIYRFRNAEPDLIDREVPNDKALNVSLHGMTPAENMNWRSAKEIVEFNNIFFKKIVAFLDETMPSCRPLAKMYDNVEQEIHYKEKSGYVEINISEENAYDKIGELITNILSRGYKQKDIVLLIDKNKDAEDLIAALFEYNKNLLSPDQKINFISEETLCISESYGVKIIISILHSIAKNNSSDINSKEVIDLVDFTRIYHYHMAKDSNLEPIEAIEMILNKKCEELPISKMLSSMHTVALPAIVEAVAKEFIPEEILIKEACYIAAFQDMIIDYCEKFPTDVPSFLNWWDNTGSKMSLSSPEGTDAVSIMTIHKSKGLEFNCVILPTCEWGFKPNSFFNETLWVKPVVANYSKDINTTLMPPYIPIDATTKLIGTPYEKIYKDYLDTIKVDMLNKTYVAFTRAKKELYIFSSVKTIEEKEENVKQADNMGYYINKVVKDGGIYSKYEFDQENHQITIKYGEPTILDNNDDCKDKKNKIGRITGYKINTTLDLLKFKSDKDDSIFDEEEDPDPRSEGNVLHLIMSNVVVSSDLHKSVLEAMVKGLINPVQAQQYEQKLLMMIEKTEMKQWFDPSLKVINERPILSNGKSINYRPDRIVIMPDNKIAVIDYKFGVLKLERYSNQIRNYVNLLNNVDEYRGYTIEGYICYISDPDNPEIIKI